MTRDESVPAGRHGVKLRWTIGRKLAVIVVACVSVGFVVLIGSQILAFSEQSYSLALNKNAHLTKLLAAQMSGGVRWRKPKAIERAYKALTSDRESSLVGVIVLDIAGEPLVRYEAHEGVEMALLDGIEGVKDQFDSHHLYIIETEHHVSIFTPVTVGQEMTRVGTLGVAWGLEAHGSQVSDELQKQIILGFVLLIALITIIISLLHMVVSMPLTAVIETTLKLAGGKTNSSVPFTDRRDEIGELARSLGAFKRNLVTIDNLSAEQRKQTEQLAAALEKEREFNAMQREFVAMASHEFRTPLTIIDSGAQRIERRLDRMDSEQIKSKTNQIRQAVQRMTTLIESVLSSASFESGSFKIDIGQCNLKTIVADVCKRQQGISASHDISVRLDELPEEIVGDARLLEQVFTNLLSNAVKYAPGDPRIDVVGRVENNEAVVSVRDYGVGIPLAEQARIYDRYFRASTATGIAGTGIGLNLASQTVELHGGRIELESEEGKGTTFSVRLPVRSLSQSAEGTQHNGDNPFDQLRATPQSLQSAS